jgi:hypothetical protein
MDRTKYPVSVVPFPADRTSNKHVVRPNDEAAWDSKWLRPNMAVVAKSNSDVKPEPKAEADEERPSLTVRALRWLFPEVNQRRAKRFPTPGLVAYYWTGGAPHSYHVGDISATGLFLLTKERWAPGTLIQMTLQVQDGRVNNSDSSICVLTEVVRWGANGAGFNFILADYENVQNYGIMPTEAIDRKSVERFLGTIGGPLAQ